MLKFGETIKITLYVVIFCFDVGFVLLILFPLGGLSNGVNFVGLRIPSYHLKTFSQLPALTDYSIQFLIIKKRKSGLNSKF